MLSALPVSTVGGAQLAECATFADGFTWGTRAHRRRQDRRRDDDHRDPDADHRRQGREHRCRRERLRQRSGGKHRERPRRERHSRRRHRAHRLRRDLRGRRAPPRTYSNYFACPGGTSCARTAVPLAQQVANPVAKFAVDNNGVIVQMPPMPDTGAPSATGTLVFGIGTQSNNALGGGAGLHHRRLRRPEQQHLQRHDGAGVPRFGLERATSSPTARSRSAAAISPASIARRPRKPARSRWSA